MAQCGIASPMVILFNLERYGVFFLVSLRIYRISKRKGAGGGGGGKGRCENGLANVKLNGLLGLSLDHFLNIIRYQVYYHYVIAISILLLRGLLSMNML